VIADSGITLPKFDRHGGGDAKRRAQTARRLAKYRRKQRNANETHGALPSGENGDGEEEEEVEEDGDERSQEKEKSFRKFRKDFFPDMAPVDSDSNGKRMNPHERKKIAERGKLIMSQEPWCSLCKEILELKAEPLDENDPNTVRKVGILWEHKDLPADELRLRIQQARDRGRKKFAYFIGLVKKRIGNDLWDSYSN
jgi:hypothetical protein